MTFLDQLADYILNTRKTGDVQLVFPNQRTGVFFRKALADKISKPIWPPSMLTFGELIYQEVNKTPAHSLTLNYELYGIFRKFFPKYDSFEKFYFWGDMLLNDFNEIDKQLADPSKIYATLADQKAMDLDLSFLTNEQLEAIKSLWGTIQNSEGKIRAGFLELWQNLHSIYKQYKDRLSEKNLFFDGMIYRQLAENPGFISNPDKIIFAGFYALTKSEEKIISWTLENDGKIFWDYPSFISEEPLNTANRFFKEYTKNPLLAPTINQQDHSQQPTKVNVLGFSSEAAMSRYVANILHESIQKKDEDPQNIGIVLPDEAQLTGVVNSLPATIDNLNITMGYPVIKSYAWQLILNLIELQRFFNDKHGISSRLALPVLQNPLLEIIYPEVKILVREITDENRVYFSNALLNKIEELKIFFSEVKNPKVILQMLIELLGRLKQHLTNTTQLATIIEEEALGLIGDEIFKLNNLLPEEEEFTYQAMIGLLKEHFNSCKLPFEGEPLKGLQVLGLMETRNLNFDNLIMLSVNEGVLPDRNPVHSFIPLNIRRAFGLSTNESREALSSYLFYRLLKPAKNIFLLYTTAEKGPVKLEKSRYIHQLRHNSNFEVAEKEVDLRAKVKKPLPIEVVKNEAIELRLKQYLNKEKGLYLTPSAISIFLDCSLKFYFTYIARLREPDELNESIDAVTFGILLHHSLEKFYQPAIKQEVKKDFFENYQQVYSEKLVKTFEEHFKHVNPEGKEAIFMEVIKRIGLKILEEDRKRTPFTIIALEETYKNSFNFLINGNTESINLGGNIDRIDKKDGQLRIIDYKTGRDSPEVKNFDYLFEGGKDRNKAAFQTILYAIIYQSEYPDTPLSAISPTLLSVKKLFDPDYDGNFMIGNKPLALDETFKERFMQELGQRLEFLFDITIPFSQTEDEAKCNFCPYKNICHRH